MGDWHDDQQLIAAIQGAPRRKEAPARVGTARHIQRVYLDPTYKVKGIRRPLYLQGFNELAEAGLMPRYRQPPSCVGLGRSVVGGRRWMCDHELCCGICWDRDRHKHALRVLQRHLHGGPVYSYSFSLPAIRQDPEKVKAAADAWWRVAKSLGWTGHSMFVHTYGENPSEGPKGHIDGFLSHLPGEEAGLPLLEGRAALHVLHPEVAKKVGDAWCTAKRHWQPVISIRRLEGKPEAVIKDLTSAAKYSGRETWPTRRFIAGRIHEDEYRLVAVGGVRRNMLTGNMAAPVELEPIPCKWTFDGLWRASHVAKTQYEAAQWNKVMGRPRHTAPAEVHRSYVRPLTTKMTNTAGWVSLWRLKWPDSWPARSR